MNKCKPILNSFGYQWPPFLNCSKFPERNDHKHMCMEGPEELVISPPEVPGAGEHVPRQPEGSEVDAGRREEEIDRDVGGSGASQRSADKCSKLAHPARYVYVNRTGTCMLRCNESALFSSSDKQLANAWLTALSALCFALTLLTLLTYVIDTTRFRYPERPVVMMSFCYCVYSLTIIIRLIAGRNAFICVNVRTGTGSGGGTASDVLTTAFTVETVVPDDGLQNTYCALTFVVLYYSSVAGALWWLVLAINWFLAAGRKWGREALEARKFIFHTVAWSRPAVLTVAALVSRSVEVDELVGVCFAGTRSRAALLAFVIVPLSIVLLVGVGFLLAGLVAMCQIRRDVRSSGERTESLERHMKRVGVFSVMYTIPAACLLACYVYEYASRDGLLKRREANGADYGDYVGDDLGLEVKVFTLRIVASLALGVSSGVWVCSCKTLATWAKACGRLCGQSPSLGASTQKTVTGSPVNALCNTTISGGGTGSGSFSANRRYVQLQSVPVPFSANVLLTGATDPLTGVPLPLSASSISTVRHNSSSGCRSSSSRLLPKTHRAATVGSRACSPLSSSNACPPDNFSRLTSTADGKSSDVNVS